MQEIFRQIRNLKLERLEVFWQTVLPVGACRVESRLVFRERDNSQVGQDNSA